MTPRVWQLGSHRHLVLDQPRVMAILNLTPDSFSDGGRLSTVEEGLAAARQAVQDGADILDLGGESTRPGSVSVSVDEQCRRVIPVLVAIRHDPELRCVPISVDTTSSHVARAALDAGADVINDTSAGRDDPDMLPLVASRDCGLILMHRLRRPVEDSYSDRYAIAPEYRDLVQQIRAFLNERAHAAVTAGIPARHIVLDPGLGFGKSVDQNLELIRRTREFTSLNFPILSGASRKSFLGKILGSGDSRPADRVSASVAASIAHYHAGARIFRVHDVKMQSQALKAAAVFGPPD